MFKMIISSGVILGCFLYSAELYAFRCGTHLVREGDHYLEVLKACGEPALQEHWVEEVVASRRAHRLLPYRQVTTRGAVVRLWTYNRGAQKFMRQLEFRDGLLKKIEKVGYGFR